jgi:UDP-glucuronate 4-epimerase
MRIVVTGAAGFIGSHVAVRLASDGHEVVGIDNYDPYYDRLIKERNAQIALDAGVERVHELDLVDAELSAALDGAEAIVHLAAQAGVRPSWGARFRRYLDANVWATQRLLEWQSSQGGTFVFVSSSSVYGGAADRPFCEDDRLCPGSPYGVSKLAAEEITHLYGREHGIKSVCVRPFSVYGPRERPDKAVQRFLLAARDGTPIHVNGDGTQRRDFTFVDDVVELIVAALERAPSGSTLNACRGETVELNEVIRLIAMKTARPLAVERGPRKSGDEDVTWGDPGRAREILGSEPRVDLEKGIALQWAAVNA